ncbi:hypothetical protein BJ508DRAFT_416834 [Ascobolus immersus RN42]|uniref:Uncharacterized protein n=1 Tax=Ascobolus immersus RN42 TaxID=1160509 RepID=A0A3N4HZ82_ASCIM|nr:hypothetical protein BJ508DRAFT_416834 [Ascobolus immersus RN42]
MVAPAPFSNLTLVVFGPQKNFNTELTHLGPAVFDLSHKLVRSSNHGIYLRLGTRGQKHRIHCIIPKGYPNIGFVVGVFHNKHQASDRFMRGYSNETGPMDDFLRRLKSQIGKKLEEDTVAVYPSEKEREVLEVLGWLEEEEGGALGEGMGYEDSWDADSGFGDYYSETSEETSTVAKNYHGFDGYEYDSLNESDESDFFI